MFQTVAGSIMLQLGHIRTSADHFEWGGWCFEVKDMDDCRIDRVLITLVASQSLMGMPNPKIMQAHHNTTVLHNLCRH